MLCVECWLCLNGYFAGNELDAEHKKQEEKNGSKETPKLILCLLPPPWVTVAWGKVILGFVT